MSEIDDIFATKGKAKATSPVADVSSIKKSKKKKSKKQKNQDQPKDEVATASSSKKRKAPETVVDPSQKIEGTAKRQKSNTESKKSTSKKEEAKFKDSRGTGGRESSLPTTSIRCSRPPPRSHNRGRLCDIQRR